jgi:hypothetical protein
MTLSLPTSPYPAPKLTLRSPDYYPILFGRFENLGYPNTSINTRLPSNFLVSPSTDEQDVRSQRSRFSE